MKRTLLSALLAIAGCLLLTAPANAGTFPGGNGRIAFSEGGDVKTILPDGGELQNLTDSSGVAELYPAWSPDGARLAYISDAGGNTNIWVMDADGSNKTQLTDTTDSKTMPTWTADGTLIVYSSEVGGQAGLYSVPAEGGSIGLFRPVNPEITTLPGIGSAQFNLQGQLLWTENFEHQPSSFVDALWTVEGNLTGDDGIFAKQGAWSPDGNSITYISCIPEDCRISGHVFRANSDGSEPQILTPTLMSITNPRQHPVFSPDGEKIVFRQGSGIRIIDAAAGGSGVLLALGNHPDWQPLVGAQPGGDDGGDGDDGQDGGSSGDDDGGGSVGPGGGEDRGGSSGPGAGEASACAAARTAFRRARVGAKQLKRVKAKSAKRLKVATVKARRARSRPAKVRAKRQLLKSRKQAKRVKRVAKKTNVSLKRARNRAARVC